jgi:hypothetical protein
MSQLYQTFSPWCTQSFHCIPESSSIVDIPVQQQWTRQVCGRCSSCVLIHLMPHASYQQLWCLLCQQGQIGMWFERWQPSLPWSAMHKCCGSCFHARSSEYSKVSHHIGWECFYEVLALPVWSCPRYWIQRRQLFWSGGGEKRKGKTSW